MSTLPEGWTENVSKKTGKTYYYNQKTGESQWDFPTDTAGKVFISIIIFFFFSWFFFFVEKYVPFSDPFLFNNNNNNNNKNNNKIKR